MIPSTNNIIALQYRFDLTANLSDSLSKCLFSKFCAGQAHLWHRSIITPRARPTMIQNALVLAHSKTPRTKLKGNIVTSQCKCGKGSRTDAGEVDRCRVSRSTAASNLTKYNSKCLNEDTTAYENDEDDCLDIVS